MCYGSDCMWETIKGDCRLPYNRKCPYFYDEWENSDELLPDEDTSCNKGDDTGGENRV